MKYIRSERLTSEQVEMLENMGFFVEVDSFREIDGRKLYSVYVSENHGN